MDRTCGGGRLAAAVAAEDDVVGQQLLEPLERAPLPVAQALHHAIAALELVVLPDAGHACSIEDPDEFNAAIRDFLHDIPE